jgi:hypothetical protein
MKKEGATRMTGTNGRMKKEGAKGRVGEGVSGTPKVLELKGGNDE